MMKSSEKNEDETEMTQVTNNRDEAEELLIPTGNIGSGETSTKKRSTGAKKHVSSLDPSLRKKKKVPKSDENATALLIKYTALFLLVAQMVGLVLLMRFSRTQQTPGQPLYLASTAVFLMECMKLVICLFVIAYQAGQAGESLLAELNQHIIHSPMEILKLCVPSLLYTIQNNLLYLALTNLDAATYQVCYQLKILTTALFSGKLIYLELYYITRGSFALSRLSMYMYMKILHLISHLFLFFSLASRHIKPLLSHSRFQPFYYSENFPTQSGQLLSF
jgi:hypothetical protein